jgi:glycosyltransferase involved in cell wall biosynthesis
VNAFPKISVVIPAYNAAKFLTRAVASVQAQTVPPHEIIIVDDGSTDHTAECARSLGSRIHVIRQANGGPASARNHGICVAEGEWIALLDADDAWMPTKLERQIPFATNKEIGLIHAQTEHDSPRDLPSILDFEAMWERNWLVTSSVLIRRTAWEAVGKFDEDRALISVEDYNLWLRLTHAGWKIATVAEPLVQYTPAPGSLSAQIERFAQAELANLARIADVLNLEPNIIRAKRIAIYEQYGRDLLYERHMDAARRFLSVPLREQPSLSHLKWWLTANLPVSLLDFRRRLKR